MGVLSRLKKRVGGTARLAKDALSALTSARAADTTAGPTAASTPAAPAPVDATDRSGERLWYLDGQQADAGWEQTNPAEAPEPRGSR